MAKPGSDQNLLFGMLALQMDFISRDDLISGMHAWVLDKANGLGQILVDRSALSESRRVMIECLVLEHIAQHGGDAGLSLAALGGLSAVRDDLAHVEDDDLHASLAQAAKSPDWGQTAGTVTWPPEPRPRFRVLRSHARGGLGEVFVAHDEELNREVALKAIQDRHADDQASRARFLLEAEITGRLEHPGIVPVYGLGRHPDGRPYYAMRFIRGESLECAIGRFHRDASLDGDPHGWARGLRRLLARFLDVCNAVAYSHSRGIMHRDLKPQNIMLGDYGETLVVDWGLAKPIGRPEDVERVPEGTLHPGSGEGSTPTEAGTVFGTPAYMSPEQASGEVDRLGPASDVYSLGATLYCVLAGRAPLEGDRYEVIRRARAGDFPPPRAANPVVPQALEAICLKAMAWAPGDRFASPRDLAEAIDRWLAEEPVVAYREAVADYEALVAEHPGETNYREGLSRGRSDLGLALLVLGRYAEAEAVHRAAIDDYRALVKDHPGVTSYREGLAGAYSNLGRVLMALGRPEDAKGAYRAAFAEYERLVKIVPHALDYRTNLGHLLVSLGRGRDDVLRTLDRRSEIEIPSTCAPVAVEPTDPDSRASELAPDSVNRPQPSTDIPSPGEPPCDDDPAFHDEVLLPASADPVPGEVLFGRYLVVEKLGEGGMGSVWLVKHREFDSERALKLIVSGIAMDEQSRKRFRREARIMDRLNHPSAVRVYDARIGQKMAFIEMEYVKGESLNKVIKAGVPMPLAEVDNLLEQLCGVLQAANDEGIIHRDLKPSNLMLVEGRVPGKKVLKLLDFGIAKIRDTGEGDPDDVRTKTGVFTGTPHYTSPEQIRGDRLDARSDIYSTGVLLYELITGSRPFTGSLNALIANHSFTTPPAFAEKNKEIKIPAEVEAVVMDCLAKDPKDRPQSPRELYERFKEALEVSHARENERDLLPTERGKTRTRGSLKSSAGAKTKTSKATGQKTKFGDAYLKTLHDSEPASVGGGRGSAGFLWLIIGLFAVIAFFFGHDRLDTGRPGSIAGLLSAIASFLDRLARYTLGSPGLAAGLFAAGVLIFAGWGRYSRRRRHQLRSTASANRRDQRPAAKAPVVPTSPPAPQVEEDRSILDRMEDVVPSRSEVSAIPPPESAESAESSDDPAGEDRLAAAAAAEFGSRYRVIRPLGQGGLGRLWVVHDLALHRDVVLKELRPDGNRDLNARRWLIKEGQIAAQLEHANIVPVYEVGRSIRDQPFYTMMYVRGRTLRDVIAEERDRPGGGGHIATTNLIDVFLQICQGVAYAHSRGVIHRDLKPENVLVGAHGEARIGDWGLAKVIGQDDPGFDRLASDPSEDLVTQVGTILGTPAYMAPELALGKLDEVDARTDLYGLGAILFEVLTGQPPYLGEAGKGIHEILDQIIKGETPRVRSINPAIAPIFDAICAKAMARRKEERHADADELIREIRTAQTFGVLIPGSGADPRASTPLVFD